MPQLYQVHEIFESVQFEGKNCGRLATFVRLAGCNLSCDFCDTEKPAPTAIKDMTAAMLCDEVGSHADLVVITGGEPTIQKLDNLLDQLILTSDVAIETNGTQIKELIRLRKKYYGLHLTVSPKQHPGWQDTYAPYTAPLTQMMFLVDEVKLVYAPFSAEFYTFWKDAAGVESVPVYIQPEWSNAVSLRDIRADAAVEYARRIGAKVSIQTHKYLNWR